MQNRPTEEGIQSVRSAVESGRKIEAVKLYREITGADLVSAKRYVDELSSAREAKSGGPGFSGDRSLIVGLGGTHNTIHVERTPGSLVCRLSSGTRALVLVLLSLFGPGALALLWIRPEADLSEAPWYILVLVLSIPVLSSLLLIWHLIRNPRIVVPLASGEVQFYRRRGGGPQLRIRRQEIKSFEVEKGWYSDSDGDATDQWTLYLITHQGGKIALCLSTQEDLIRGFCRDLETTTGCRRFEY